MKKISRILSCFITLFLLMTIFSINAFAEDSTVTPTSKSELESMAKAFLKKNMDMHNSTFTITYKNAANNFLSNTFSYVNGAITPQEMYFTKEQFEEFNYTPGNDYTSICLLAGNGTNLNMSMTTMNSKIFELKAVYTVAWGESLSQTHEVESFAQTKVNELCKSGMSGYEKIKALHDFIVNSYSYDKTLKKYYPYELYSTKSGVCQAYAGLMYQMLIKAGFEARIITKDSSASQDGQSWQDHAWNLVKLDGKWYHIDVTWDDPVTSNGQPMLRYDYFLKGDTYMLATHKWNRTYYSAATADYKAGTTSVSNTPTSSQRTSSAAKTSSKAASQTTVNNISNKAASTAISATVSTTLSETSASTGESLITESTAESQSVNKKDAINNKSNNTIIFIAAGSLAGIIIIGAAVFVLMKKKN